MKNFVVFGKGVEYFYAKEDFVNLYEQLIKECDTFEEAKELSNHLNRVRRGERLKFNGYSVVYGKGVEFFFVIEGDGTNPHELLIETFETKEEAEEMRKKLNKKNGLENL